MHKSTELQTLATLEDAAHRVELQHSIAPIVPLRQLAAGNRAAGGAAAVSRDEDELWTREALAGNGLGDVSTAETGSYEWPTNSELYRAARANRAFTLGEMLATAIRTLGSIARQALARYRQRRVAAAARDALRQLDDRTLHDIGLDRSEISSVVAEMAEEARTTPARLLRKRRTPPGTPRTI